MHHFQLIRTLIFGLVNLGAISCGPTEGQERGDLRSSDHGKKIDVRITESSVLALADVDTVVTNFKVRVVECVGSTENVLKEVDKAGLANLYIAKSQQNLRIYLSSLTIQAGGATGVVTPVTPVGTNGCAYFGGHLLNKTQSYTGASAAVAAIVQLENGVDSGDLAASSQTISVAFDIAASANADLGAINSTVATPARQVSVALSGATPPAFSLAKEKILDASPAGTNECVFKATLKCSKTPVVQNGKLKSCDGVELASTTWKLDQILNGTAISQPQGSTNLGAGGTLNGTDSIDLSFKFTCSRGQAGIQSEVRALVLDLQNRDTCDANSKAINQCGKAQFKFSLNLKYSNP